MGEEGVNVKGDKLPPDFARLRIHTAMTTKSTSRLGISHTRGYHKTHFLP